MGPANSFELALTYKHNKDLITLILKFYITYKNRLEGINSLLRTKLLSMPSVLHKLQIFLQVQVLI